MCMCVVVRGEKKIPCSMVGIRAGLKTPGLREKGLDRERRWKNIKELQLFGYLLLRQQPFIENILKKPMEEFGCQL